MTTRRRALQSVAPPSLAALAPRALGAQMGGVRPAPGRDPIDDAAAALTAS